MSTPETQYQSIIEKMTQEEGVTSSQMFGMPCLKVNGKAFAGLHKGKVMTFKLTDMAHKEALSLSGAELFDPGMGRPMKEWVVVPVEYKDKWFHFAREAKDYVEKLKK
jgi:hypothetical protein